MVAISKDFHTHWEMHAQLRQSLGDEAYSLEAMCDDCAPLIGIDRARAYHEEERHRYQVAYIGTPDQLAAVALIKELVPGEPGVRWAKLAADVI